MRNGMEKYKMLIVVDMINDFVHPEGALYFDGARETIPTVQKEFEKHQETGLVTISLCDSHKENDKEFDRFPPHAIEGTWGSQIIDELTYPHTSFINHVIEKTRYSGFYNTRLDSLIKIYRPEEVTIVGVCTSICVMDTVGGLANRDVPNIKVVESGVADFDNDMHNMSLERMKNIYGAEIV